MKISKEELREIAGERRESSKTQKPRNKDALDYLLQSSGLYEGYKPYSITTKEFYIKLIKAFKDDADTIQKIRKIYQGEL